MRLPISNGKIMRAQCFADPSNVGFSWQQTDPIGMTCYMFRLGADARCLAILPNANGNPYHGMRLGTHHRVLVLKPLTSSMAFLEGPRVALGQSYSVGGLVQRILQECEGKIAP